MGERCSLRHVNMTLSLTFLSPALTKAAVEGRLPRGIGLERCANFLLNGTVSSKR
jgi:hypothetical protein